MQCSEIKCSEKSINVFVFVKVFYILLCIVSRHALLL